VKESEEGESWHWENNSKTHGTERKGGRKCGNTKKGGSKRFVYTERNREG
jgi:hypothetical protein